MSNRKEKIERETKVAEALIHHINKDQETAYEIKSKPDEEGTGRFDFLCEDFSTHDQLALEITRALDWGGDKIPLIITYDNMIKQLKSRVDGKVSGTFFITLPHLLHFKKGKEGQKHFEAVIDVVERFVIEKCVGLSVGKNAAMRLCDHPELKDWMLWMKREGYRLTLNEETIKLVKTKNDGSILGTIGASTGYITGVNLVRSGKTPATIPHKDEQLATAQVPHRVLAFDSDESDVSKEVIVEKLKEANPQYIDRVFRVWVDSHKAEELYWR